MTRNEIADKLRSAGLRAEKRAIDVFALGGIVDVHRAGERGSYATVVAFTSFNPLKPDKSLPFFREFKRLVNGYQAQQSNPDIYDFRLAPQRLSERFIPLEGIGYHETVGIAHRHDSGDWKIYAPMQMLRDDLAAALKQLGCDAPARFGMVDPKTGSFGFEAATDEDFTILRVRGIKWTREEIDRLTMQGMEEAINDSKRMLRQLQTQRDHLEGRV